LGSWEAGRLGSREARKPGGSEAGKLRSWEDRKANTNDGFKVFKLPSLIASKPPSLIAL